MPIRKECRPADIRACLDQDPGCIVLDGALSIRVDVGQRLSARSVEAQ